MNDKQNLPVTVFRFHGFVNSENRTSLINKNLVTSSCFLGDWFTVGERVYVAANQGWSDNVGLVHLKGLRPTVGEDRNLTQAECEITKLMIGCFKEMLTMTASKLKETIFAALPDVGQAWMRKMIADSITIAATNSSTGNCVEKLVSLADNVLEPLAKQKQNFRFHGFVNSADRVSKMNGMFVTEEACLGDWFTIKHQVYVAAFAVNGKAVLLKLKGIRGEIVEDDRTLTKAEKALSVYLTKEIFKLLSLSPDALSEVVQKAFPGKGFSFMATIVEKSITEFNTELTKPVKDKASKADQSMNALAKRKQNFRFQSGEHITMPGDWAVINNSMHVLLPTDVYTWLELETFPIWKERDGDKLSMHEREFSELIVLRYEELVSLAPSKISERIRFRFDHWRTAEEKTWVRNLICKLVGLAKEHQHGKRTERMFLGKISHHYGSILPGDWYLKDGEIYMDISLGEEKEELHMKGFCYSGKKAVKLSRLYGFMSTYVLSNLDIPENKTMEDIRKDFVDAAKANKFERPEYHALYVAEALYKRKHNNTSKGSNKMKIKNKFTTLAGLENNSGDLVLKTNGHVAMLFQETLLTLDDECFFNCSIDRPLTPNEQWVVETVNANLPSTAGLKYNTVFELVVNQARRSELSLEGREVRSVVRAILECHELSDGSPVAQVTSGDISESASDKTQPVFTTPNAINLNAGDWTLINDVMHVAVKHPLAGHELQWLIVPFLDRPKAGSINDLVSPLMQEVSDFLKNIDEIVIREKHVIAQLVNGAFLKGGGTFAFASSLTKSLITFKSFSEQLMMNQTKPQPKFWNEAFQKNQPFYMPAGSIIVYGGIAMFVRKDILNITAQTFSLASIADSVMLVGGDEDLASMAASAPRVFKAFDTDVPEKFFGLNEKLDEAERAGGRKLTRIEFVSGLKLAAVSTLLDLQAKIIRVSPLSGFVYEYIAANKTLHVLPPTSEYQMRKIRLLSQSMGLSPISLYGLPGHVLKAMLNSTCGAAPMPTVQRDCLALWTKVCEVGKQSLLGNAASVADSLVKVDSENTTQMRYLGTVENLPANASVGDWCVVKDEIHVIYAIVSEGLKTLTLPFYKNCEHHLQEPRLLNNKEVIISKVILENLVNLEHAEKEVAERYIFSSLRTRGIPHALALEFASTITESWYKNDDEESSQYLRKPMFLGAVTEFPKQAISGDWFTYEGDRFVISDAFTQVYMSIRMPDWFETCTFAGKRGLTTFEKAISGLVCDNFLKLTSLDKHGGLHLAETYLSTRLARNDALAAADAVVTSIHEDAKEDVFTKSTPKKEIQMKQPQPNIPHFLGTVAALPTTAIVGDWFVLCDTLYIVTDYTAEKVRTVIDDRPMITTGHTIADVTFPEFCQAPYAEARQLTSLEAGISFIVRGNLASIKAMGSVDAEEYVWHALKMFVPDVKASAGALALVKTLFEGMEEVEVPIEKQINPLTVAREAFIKKVTSVAGSSEEVVSTAELFFNTVGNAFTLTLDENDVDPVKTVAGLIEEYTKATMATNTTPQVLGRVQSARDVVTNRPRVIGDAVEGRKPFAMRSKISNTAPIVLCDLPKTPAAQANFLTLTRGKFRNVSIVSDGEYIAANIQAGIDELQNWLNESNENFADTGAIRDKIIGFFDNQFMK